MLDIFNKIQTIYTWSSNTDTKTNQIYTWFSNIYNELNSTSTSYMKGKINSIYNNIGSGGMGIKSVQWGYMVYVSQYQTFNHNSVDINKSFIILNSSEYQSSSRNTGGIRARNSTSFEIHLNSSSQAYYSWQLIEFY